MFCTQASFSGNGDCIELPDCRDSLERSWTCLTAFAWKSLGEYAKSLVKALRNRTDPLAHKPTHIRTKERSKIVSWQLPMLYRFQPMATRSLKESLSQNQIRMVKYKLLQSHCAPLFTGLQQPTEIKMTSVRITSILKILTSQYNWNVLYVTAVCENRLIFRTMWDTTNNMWVHYLLQYQKNQREFTCVFALRFFLSGLPSCTPGPPNPSNPLSPPTKFQSVQYCISFLTDCVSSLPLFVIATDTCYKYWTCTSSGG